uniref:Uncharacterized protein n=1 Tax=Anguilla anguilla TaxID=7936 RepID=A0A0E9XX11_ANGAN
MQKCICKISFFGKFMFGNLNLLFSTDTLMQKTKNKYLRPNILYKNLGCLRLLYSTVYL